MFCYNCGKEVEKETKFCPYCGVQLDVQGPTNDGGYQPINQQPTYQQQTSYARADDAPSTGFFILSLFVPIVGIILFAVWSKEYPLKAKSCLKGFVTGLVVYVVLVCCFMTAFAGLISSIEDDYYYYNTFIQPFIHG